MKEISVAILIGLSAGIAGGIFGIGGGVIIVPALIAFLGFSQFKAQGTSLVALLAPVGLLAMIEYWRKNEVDFRVGSFIGGWPAWIPGRALAERIFDAKDLCRFFGNPFRLAIL
jgi:uncharacterized membrane protein YfcA